jgi:hypothetical protein
VTTRTDQVITTSSYAVYILENDEGTVMDARLIMIATCKAEFRRV